MMVSRLWRERLHPRIDAGAANRRIGIATFAGRHDHEIGADVGRDLHFVDVSCGDLAALGGLITNPNRPLFNIMRIIGFTTVC